MPQEATNPALYACPECGARFTRLEHLQRHTVSLHSGDRPKPFSCEFCGKAFSRRDIVVRHRQSCPAAQETTPTVNRNAQPTKRACKICTEMKLKCSGGPRCDRCTALDRDCEYAPDRRQRSSRAKKTASEVETTAGPSEGDNSMAQLQSSLEVAHVESAAVDRNDSFSNQTGIQHTLESDPATLEHSPRLPEKVNKRGRYVSVACESCRRRRLKCTGEAICPQCKNAGVPCVYNTQGRKRRSIRTEKDMMPLMKDPANPPHFDFSNHNPGNMSESMLEIMARVSSLEREYNAMKNHISTAVDGDDAACSPDRATTTSSPTSSTISAISLPESERFHSASCLFTPIEVVNSTAAREDGKHPDYSVSSMETAYPSPKKVFWLNLQPVAPQSLESMEQETRMYDTAVLRRSFDIFFSHQNQHIPCVNEKQFRAQFDSFLQNDSEGSADQHQFVALVNLIHAQIVFLTGDWTDASKVPPAWDEFCRAENILNQLTWLGSGNILTIQCLLIKGLYLLYIENSDAAYNAMSQVVRLCFKLGLHDQSSWNCDSLELATRQKLFWTIFFLDRYISFNNGAPYLLRECDFDVELPELLPEESLDRSPVPFLSAAVKWAQLCSEIWDTVFAKKAQKAAVSEEFVASMDARILYSISRLPQHLQWANNRHRLKGTTDVPFYVLRQTVILHLLNNQLRLLLRQESILGQKYSIATANECVEIASNTIEALYDYHGIQQPIGRFASVFYSVSALLHLACIILGDHDSQKTRANAIEAFNKGLIMLQDLYPTFVLARHTFQRLCRIIDTVKRAMLKFNNTELQDPKEFPVPNLAATGFPQTTGFWSQDQPIDPNGDMIAQMSNGFSDSFWPTGVRVGWTTDELNVFCMDDDLRRLCDISGL